MIHIQKGTPPNKFQEFKHQNPQAHFDDMPPDIKSTLRQSLLEEQGYLCAYCMSKIRDKVKIEHYEPRNTQNELDYSNLLAVCTGNSEGDSFKHQHCDTKKDMISKKSAPTELLSRGSRVRVTPSAPYIEINKASHKLRGFFRLVGN